MSNDKLKLVGKTSSWGDSSKGNEPSDWKQTEQARLNDQQSSKKADKPPVKTATWTASKDPIEQPLDDKQANKADLAAEKALDSIEKAMGKGKGKGAAGRKKGFSNHTPANTFDQGDDWWSGGAYTGTGKGGGHQACYHSHPPFKFTGKDGVEYTMYGGNGRNPTVKGCDIYIGFDNGASDPGAGYPWEPDYHQAILVDYYIPDMNAPKNVTSFKKMVDWVCNQLQLGKKIHAGCIGGHGRTGTFLSAVYAQMTGEKDAIQYVRKHYCKKAVETDTQITFLMDHYGVSKAEGTKSYSTTYAGSYGGSGKMNGYQGSSGGKVTPTQFKDAKRKIMPVQSNKCIW